MLFAKYKKKISSENDNLHRYLSMYTIPERGRRLLAKKGEEKKKAKKENKNTMIRFHPIQFTIRSDPKTDCPVPDADTDADADPGPDHISFL
jgi:isopentenyldiphosphate isomerase